ncbi:MAG: superoxide dismutase [Methylotenera sp.]|nr:MAG: superoxide dismutase [Methylotenera sp.]
MSSRRDFLQSSAAIAGSLALTSNLAQAGGKQRMAINKLTDNAGKYVLAPLPYAYDALEPVIDARTVELHYNFHHKPAVAAANKAEDALASARAKNDFSLVKHYEKELAFQLSSHILHTIYWTNLSPKEGIPVGRLLKALEQNFQSFDQFKSHIIAATVGVEGAGWGILGYLPSSGKLMILQCENHHKLTAWGIIPILVLDVWEHAYYLKYQNKRAEYINGLFSIINWDNVALRYESATT